MKVLELFSGSHSVGKVCEELGYEVLSVDIDGHADINMSILDWDYKSYKPKEFDYIWASPPCHTFSLLRRCHIGRKLKVFGDQVVTHEMLDNDMIQNGVPLLKRTLEIIEYFKPKLYFIENPKTGKMKEFLKDLPYYDVDYCAYTDWGYKKPTRIWTNKKDFIPKRCLGKDCPNIVNNKHKATVDLVHSLKLKYRVPPNLIRELIS